MTTTAAARLEQAATRDGCDYAQDVREVLREISIQRELLSSAITLNADLKRRIRLARQQLTCLRADDVVSAAAVLFLYDALDLRKPLKAGRR